MQQKKLTDVLLCVHLVMEVVSFTDHVLDEEEDERDEEQTVLCVEICCHLDPQTEIGILPNVIWQNPRLVSLVAAHERW